MSDKYKACPLISAGFTLVSFVELGRRVFGADGKCICTERTKCLNVDKANDNRCTISEIKRLDLEAMSRRSRQTGE